IQGEAGLELGAASRPVALVDELARALEERVGSRRIPSLRRLGERRRGAGKERREEHRKASGANDIVAGWVGHSSCSEGSMRLCLFDAPTNRSSRGCTPRWLARRGLPVSRATDTEIIPGEIGGEVVPGARIQQQVRGTAPPAATQAHAEA